MTEETNKLSGHLQYNLHATDTLENGRLIPSYFGVMGIVPSVELLTRGGNVIKDLSQELRLFSQNSIFEEGYATLSELAKDIARSHRDTLGAYAAKFPGLRMDVGYDFVNDWNIDTKEDLLMRPLAVQEVRDLYREFTSRLEGLL